MGNVDDYDTNVASGILVWNRRSWIIPGAADEALEGFRAVMVTGKGDGKRIILAGTNATATTGVTTTVNNPGSARVYPRFIADLSANKAQFSALENHTTKTMLYLNIYPLTSTEADQVNYDFDFHPGRRKFTSLHRGDITDRIRPGSDTNWFLEPGDNNVLLNMDGAADGSSTFDFLFRAVYLSEDGLA